MFTAKLTSKGQLTLPAPIRKSLEVGEGDQVVFVESEYGYIVMNPNDLKMQKRLTWKELRDSFEGAAEEAGWKDIDDVVAYIKEMRKENENND